MICTSQDSQCVVLASPIGLWKTIDDPTGSPRALVRICEKGGKLFGQIEKVFEAGAENLECEACKDERKNQPIIGLIIIRDIKQAGNAFGGGRHARSGFGVGASLQDALGSRR
jgi:hypothetical protein